MGKNDIIFSNDMKKCLDILEEAVSKIDDNSEKEKADFAIKYLQETAKKGIEPMEVYEVARGCPTGERKIKTGTVLI